MENDVMRAAADLAAKAEQAMSQLLNTDYVFISVVDIPSRRVKLCGGRLPLGPEINEDDFVTGIAGALRELVQEEYYEECVQAMSLESISQALEQEDQYTCYFPARVREDGSMGIWQWRCQRLVNDPNKFILTCADATETMSGEYDILTGLYNQQGFYRHAKARLRSGKRFKLIRFDIDNFKMLNDTLGYQQGDKLLKDIGLVLMSEHRRVIAARLDADHFVLMMPEDGMTPEELYGGLEEWLQEYRQDFPLFAHMGVYCLEEGDEDVSLMCDKAKMALRSIKGSFSQRIAYYDNSFWAQVKLEQELCADMEKALAEGQFKVYFQPQINYEDGTLVGAEALVRWQHPEKGVISPGVFIPLFENNGFISRLDEYVWEQSCAYMRKWMDAMDRFIPVSISVNISRIDIYNHSLCSKLKALVDKYGLPADMLKLEITESAYVQNPAQLISAVKELRREGFIMEMDDFGSGYSSLNILKDVPVDILKLDMRFLSGGEDEVRGGNILSSVIRMARWLKLPVIAEGVETKAQADYLKSLGCLYMQGFFFAKPMPADEFEKMIHDMYTGVVYRYQDVSLEGAAAFWDPSAQITLLFNSFVGGAAIMEYRDEELEIVRANDKFFSELNTTREKYQRYQTKPLSRLSRRNRRIYLDMLEEAIETGGEAECEVESLPYEPGERGYWTCNRVRMLARNSDGSCLFYLSVSNVTERKEMEEQIKVSEDALRLAMSQTGRVMCSYDIASRTLFLPEKYAGQRGLPIACHNVPETPVMAIPEDQAKFKDFFERMIRGEKSGAVELRVVSAEGTGYAWERAEFVTMFGEDGHPLRGVITIEDVTQRKDIEAEHARNRIIIEQTGMCIFDYDVVTDTMHYQTVHKGAGLVKKDIPQYLEHIGSRDSTICPEDRAGYEAMVRRVIAESPGSGTEVFRSNNWNTGYRWSRYNYVSLGDDMGRVHRVIGQIVDIHDEKTKQTRGLGSTWIYS